MWDEFADDQFFTRRRGAYDRARARREAREQAITLELQRRAELERTNAEVEHRMQMLQEYGQDDPFQDGQILYFTRTFVGSDIMYRYAALRSDGKWYMTGGKSPQGAAWRDLALWLVSGDRPVSAGEVVVVTGESISLRGALDRS